MTERAALVAAIEADPDSDLPRLVYADWLEETGDIRNRLRAAFVRVQCESAVRPTPELDRRERTLLRAVLRSLPTAFQQMTFRRGFLHNPRIGDHEWEEISCSADGHEPLSDIHLVASQSVPHLVRLALDPRLKRVSRLSGHHLAPLFASPHLHRLVAVETAERQDIRWIADSRSQFQLQSLVVDAYYHRWNAMERESALALASNPRFATLQRLTLRNAGFGPDEVRILTESKSLSPTLYVTVHEQGWSAKIAAQVARILHARFPNATPQW